MVYIAINKFDTLIIVYTDIVIFIALATISIQSKAKLHHEYYILYTLVYEYLSI